ncbi:MAG: NnrU family protein [Woeseiaceae bacterium]|nr:NnrU family protein [Woeseiaceae bacterium]
MIYLVSGLIVFFGIHSLPMMQPARNYLVSRLGESGFKGLFTLVSFAGFGLILLGTSRAEFRPVFAPPEWTRIVAGLVMPVAFCLLVAAFVPNNFRRVVRHPMLSGVFLWAFAHLLANGDLASILLFASFAVYSVVDVLSVNRRKAAPEYPRQPLGFDVLVLAIGFTAFWLVRHYHAALFGVPV